MTRVDLLPHGPQTRPGVLGSQITPLDLDSTVRLLIEMVRSRAKGYVCIANVHTTILAARDERFRKVVETAAAVVADGMPILWRVRAAGHVNIGRVHGVDLVEAACKTGIQERLRHGFFGGSDGVAEEMAARLRQHYPGLEVAGVWNPGAIGMDEMAPAHLINAINKEQCDILWVGLGAPKQEIWMAQHRSRLTTPVLVGVGQAFDILSGRTARAPGWMGSCGLEWLYRLAHDPGRLWKRYLMYNTLFLWYLLLERIGMKSGDHFEQSH